MDGVHKTFGEFMMAKTKFMKGEILKLEKKNEQTRMTLIEKGVCLLKKKRRRKIYYVFISLFSHHLVQQSSKKNMPIHYYPVFAQPAHLDLACHFSRTRLPLPTRYHLLRILSPPSLLMQPPILFRLGTHPSQGRQEHILRQQR